LRARQPALLIPTCPQQLELIPSSSTLYILDLGLRASQTTSTADKQGLKYASITVTIDSQSQPNHPVRGNVPSTSTSQPDAALEHVYPADIARLSATDRSARRGRSTTPTASTSLIPSTRARHELEEDSDEPSYTAHSSSPTARSYLHPSSSSRYSPSSRLNHPRDTDPDTTRAKKRPRIDSLSSVTSVERTLLHEDSFASTTNENTTMRLHESENDTTPSVSLDSLAGAGPSTSSIPISSKHNGVTKTNGFSAPYTNGNSKTRISDGLAEHPPDRGRSAISRVSLPGSTLYDDSYVDREEFVRLVIQSLRDVGYMYVFIFFVCFCPVKVTASSLSANLLLR